MSAIATTQPAARIRGTSEEPGPRTSGATPRTGRLSRAPGPRTGGSKVVIPLSRRLSQDKPVSDELLQVAAVQLGPYLTQPLIRLPVLPEPFGFGLAQPEQMHHLGSQFPHEPARAHRERSGRRGAACVVGAEAQSSPARHLSRRRVRPGGRGWPRVPSAAPSFDHRCGRCTASRPGANSRLPTAARRHRGRRRRSPRQRRACRA